MMFHVIVYRVLVLGIFTLYCPTLSFGADLDKPMESVEGEGCYRYSDDEPPAIAKKKAMAIAREQAVSNYRVWVESSTKVKNFELKEDLIQTISGGMLYHIQIQNEIRKNQEICMSIRAELDPKEIDQKISQRLGQRDIQDSLSSDSLTPEPAFGLRIWLDKPDGQYLEDDYLVIKVQSEQDAYLKLDYFQADCNVVHLVPSIYRQQAFIQKGQIFEFGGEYSPERFVISEPLGDETIMAVASQKPFLDSLIPKEATSNCKKYVQTLQDGLKLQPGFQSKGTRGIKLKSGMASAKTTLYTSSKEVVEHKKDLIH
jgi:hypothetical protein